jgi:hypothetical protein
MAEPVRDKRPSVGHAVDTAPALSGELCDGPAVFTDRGVDGACRGLG